MKHRFGMPREGLALALALLTASAGWADSVRVGDASADKGRSQAGVTFGKWSGTAPKDVGQADVNKPVKAKVWTAAEIAQAKADLAAYANSQPDNEDKRNTRRIMANNPELRDRFGRPADDMPPSWYVEWLKIQSDVTAQFIKPPPNKIMIVDQDALSKMTEAEKKNLKVQYRKTTVCERIVTYKPIYKTIEVAYPG